MDSLGMYHSYMNYSGIGALDRRLSCHLPRILRESRRFSMNARRDGAPPAEMRREWGRWSLSAKFSIGYEELLS
jgi:hypothetical protein